MLRPNLFDFATSELSQDAVFCWLLSWANPTCQNYGLELHEVGERFLKLLFERANVKLDQIRSVVVQRQVGNIDILCIVNDLFAIIIEDKTGSVDHSNQLERYKSFVSKVLGYDHAKIIPVYLQTGDQSSFDEVIRHKYTIVSRVDLLTILEKGSLIGSDNRSDILDDFTSCLRRREDSVQSYKTLFLDEWTHNSWKGFFSEVQRILEEGNWKYVANPSGGFLGYCWNFVCVEDYLVFLQLEESRFCMKVEVRNKLRQREVRDLWCNLICKESAILGLPVVKPKRFGKGTWMTVAVWNEEYRTIDSDGVIDIVSTVDILKQGMNLLNDICTKYKIKS